MQRFVVGFAAGIFLVPVLLFLAGTFGLLPTTATATPPAWEVAFARHALHVAAARRATGLKNPVAPTEDNLRAGLKMFRGNCAGCHGSPTESTDGINLYPLPPRFVDEPPTLSEGQLFWIVKNGVRYSGMFGFGGPPAPDSTGRDPNDTRIWQMVTFLSHLTTLPPAVDSAWRAKPMSSH
jgi:mono/diheme cytochrome c family protein